jgi:predicted RNase H-like HicB family nuclease
MCKKPYVEIEREEDGRWVAEVSALPGAIAYGATPGEAFVAVRTLESQILKSREEHGEALSEKPIIISEACAAIETTAYPLSESLRRQLTVSIKKVESRSIRHTAVGEIWDMFETSLFIGLGGLIAITLSTYAVIALVTLYRYFQH